MNRILWMLAGVVLLTAAQGSSPRVFDDEGVLAPEEISMLSNLYLTHERQASNQMALATTADFGDADGALDFATAKGNEMGIGLAEEDNGVLIVFSKQQRETAIAVGLGLESVLTDSICQHVINTQMIPAFKAGKVFDGLMDGSQEIINILEKKNE